MVVDLLAAALRQDALWKADAADEPTFGSVSRFIVATTSSAVSGFPSCHFTPWRSLKVQVDAVLPCFQETASFGESEVWRCA